MYFRGKYFCVIPLEIRNDMDFKVDCLLDAPQQEDVTFTVTLTIDGSQLLWTDPEDSMLSIVIGKFL